MKTAEAEVKILMKKRITQIISMVLVIAVCIALLPANAQAAEKKYVYQSAGTLKAGRYMTTKAASLLSNPAIYYAYKLTVPENGYITITRADTNGPIYLLPKLSKCDTKKMILENALDVTFNSQKDYMVVSKGTYYLCSPNQTKFKYSFTKSVQTANYCKEKAASLKAKKTTVICMNKGYEYSRWYKVKLTKKKPLTVIFKNLRSELETLYPNFTVYNSSWNVVACPLQSGTKYKTGSLSKGTYYIRVDYRGFTRDVRLTTDQRLFSISWK